MDIKLGAFYDPLLSIMRQWPHFRSTQILNTEPEPKSKSKRGENRKYEAEERFTHK